MKNAKQALLGRLPKRYHDRVIDFTEEDGLIDECKYILHYSHDYTDGECKGGTLPCRSIKEACEFVRDLQKVNDPRTKYYAIYHDNERISREKFLSKDEALQMLEYMAKRYFQLLAEYAKIKDSTMVVVYTGLCDFISECEVKEVTEGRK